MNADIDEFGIPSDRVMEIKSQILANMLILAPGECSSYETRPQRCDRKMVAESIFSQAEY